MFSADSTAMNYSLIKAKAQEVANMYRVRLTLIRHDDSASKGYRLRKIVPQKEAS
jgi:hypothetical protein